MEYALEKVSSTVPHRKEDTLKQRKKMACIVAETWRSKCESRKKGLHKLGHRETVNDHNSTPPTVGWGRKKI